jgi:hypothetical protein
MVNVDKIIAYENGDLDAGSTIEMFAEMVRDGSAWSLQGHYGRNAAALIREGFISPEGKVLRSPEYDF